MTPTRTCAALGALLATMMLLPVAQATMRVQHDCALRDPLAGAPTTPRATASPTPAAGTRMRAPRDYSLQVASLRTGNPRVHAGNARELVGDRNLQAMLESAVGDIGTLTQVIGADTLVAMRDAERERRAPAEFQARITVVFEDDSRAGFITTVGHPVAKYVLGSARAADGTQIADKRCSTAAEP